MPSLPCLLRSTEPANLLNAHSSSSTTTTCKSVCEQKLFLAAVFSYARAAARLRWLGRRGGREGAAGPKVWRSLSTARGSVCPLTSLPCDLHALCKGAPVCLCVCVGGGCVLTLLRIFYSGPFLSIRVSWLLKAWSKEVCVCLRQPESVGRRCGAVWS